MTELAGRNAIVTGGATLLGARIVDALVRQGARVILADIDEEGGREAADAHAPDSVRFHHVDITSDEGLDGLVNEALDAWDGIDVLVNGAATYLDNHLATTRDEWLHALNTNLVSGALLTARTAPHMQARGGGAVVNIASISGKRAQPLFFVYSVTKAAILGITRNQAIMLREQNIRVNSVSPGWIWSNPIKEMSGGDRSKVDAVGEHISLRGRIGDPEEVGEAVAFLASDRASYITGTDLAVDGGYTTIGPEQMGEPLASLLGEE